jgi:DNA-binding NtrC family response regulator
MNEACNVLQSHGVFLPANWVARLVAIVDQVTDVRSIVVIRGEPGTGKEVVARVFHAVSSRQSGPFVKVDCSTQPVDRLAVTLCGNEAGALAGAGRRRLGAIEFAHRGTLYLDHIDALPPSLHPHVLHLLQHHDTMRLGGHRSVRVDVQIIAATRHSLSDAEGARTFSPEFDALRVLDLQLAPLRERKADIEALTSFFLRRFGTSYGRDLQLSPETVRLLTEYAWPGNLRELRALIKCAVRADDPALVRSEIQAKIERPGSRDARSA